MQPLDFIRFNKTTDPSNRVAVVFVHGFSGDLRKTWGRIPELLESSGLLPGWDLFGFGYSSSKWIDLLGLWSADPDLERITDKLITTLDLNAKKYKLAFVAHSMGGLVVQRALVLNAALRNATTHVTLFGTPSDGLAKAQRASWFKQQAHDMAKGGAFVTALRRDWTSLHLDTNPPFRFLSVAGEMDQFVDPHSSLDPFPKSVQRVIAGNHISMLKAESGTAPSVQIVLQTLTSNAAGAGARSAASVAVDAGDFQQVINRFWDNRNDLDDRGAVQLAIALSSKGRVDDAIEFLQSRPDAPAEVLGVLAGRLKRRWLLTSSSSDFEHALDLYRKGYNQSVTLEDCDQAYYHAINIAYLLVARIPQDLEGARQMAQNTLDQCAASSKPSHWRLASEADAAIILGRFQEGFQKHQQAASSPGVKAWEALSMEEQALRVAELSGVSRDDGAKLAAIYEGV